MEGGTPPTEVGEEGGREEKELSTCHQSEGEGGRQGR